MNHPSPAVVHAADYGGAYSGNFVSSLRALEAPCRSMGLRLVLAFSDLGGHRPFLDELRADGVRVHVLRRDGSLVERTKGLARVANEENAALLHAHFTRWDVPAAVVGAVGATPVVWHLHSAFPPLRGARFRTTTVVKFRLLARRAHIAAVSKDLVREAILRGCPPERVSYVPNSIDVAHATRTTAGRDETRRQLGVARSAQVALAFGWDPGRKGVDVALSAVEALVSSGREIVLVLVGGEALEKFVADRVGHSLPGWLRVLRPRESVGDLYAAADLFLSPSRAEGFPYSLGEALANGLPVVTSDIAGVEWARALDAAIFFPADRARAAAQAMTEVLSWAPERRAAAAAQARGFAAAQLSLGSWADRVTAVYRRVLAGRSIAQGDLDLRENGPDAAAAGVASGR